MLRSTAALFAFVVVPFASAASQANDLSRPMPFDSAVTIVTLDNGLRYYVRLAQRPEKRAELRLVVNAGSILEADDQRGLAHFAEHMAFNGTRRFPKQDLVHYLESIGMRFGADLNAYTSFDETVYMLTVPTDSGTFLEKGFDILADWAQGVTFDSAQIEAERGVVIEEWRSGRGAGARMRDQQFPVLLKDSRYVERLPIGDSEYLRTFPHEALKRFYRDWYRPDLMAVIAVGDFDKAKVEKMIRDRFAALPKPRTPVDRPKYTIPPHDSTYVTIATDKEATNSSVSIYHLQPVREQLTIASYRQAMVERLFNGMLNLRFGEMVQKPDPPFVGASSGQGLFVRSAEVYSIGAGVRDGGVLRGLDAILTEAERVARHGFTATELDRLKTNMLRGYERSFAERDRRVSESHAAEFVRNFLEAEAIQGAARELEYHQRFLPGITLDEVNRLAREWLGGKNRVITVNAPDKPGVPVPTEAELLAVFAAVKAKNIEPYADVVSNQPLIARLPTPAAVTSERKIPEVGVTEWKLANGVRVVLKPTTFQADQIIVSGSSPGGYSLVPDSLYVSASFATAVVGAGGLGAFSSVDLNKALTGKVANATAGIGSRTEAISGSASPKDVETMFQLMYLRFTAPRKDSLAFVAWRQRLTAGLEGRNASPQVAFTDTLNATMSQNHYRSRPLTAQVLQEVNLDRALAFYRDRFADASDFTFVIVGNFSVDSIKPLVQRYLGGLPSTNRKEAGRDEGVRPPTGVIEKTVKRGVEPQSRTVVRFTGPFEYSPVNQHLLGTLGDVLELRLTERLREAMGGTYGASVGGGGTREPPLQYTFNVSFGSAPERADELMKAVLDEIQMLKDSGATAADLEKVKETQKRELEGAMTQNGFWSTQLAYYFRYNEDPRGILTDEGKLIDGLTSVAIRDAARKYLRTDNYVRVVLLPEK